MKQEATDPLCVCYFAIFDTAQKFATYTAHVK